MTSQAMDEKSMEFEVDGTNHLEDSHSADGGHQGLVGRPLKTTAYQVIFSAFVGISGWMYNFDLGFSGVVLLMKPYNRSFGRCVFEENAQGDTVERCFLTATEQGLISLAIIFIGIGAFAGGHIGHYLGRRGTISLGCLIIAIGAGGMLGTAGNFTAYMACKCIQGVGLGNLLAAVPPYGVECVSPSKRGMLMATFNIGLATGNMVAVAVCLASSRHLTNISWQTPIACQVPIAVLLGTGVQFFPESPRWLLLKGREEAARKSFAKFYSRPADSPEILAQVQETLYYLELERSFSKDSKWSDIFRGTDLKRTIASTLVGIAIAITGSKFLSTYAAIFLAGVGISNPYHITLTYAACTCIGALLSPWLVEFVGRRYALLIGYGSMAVFMFIIAAVGTALGQENSSCRTTSIVFISFWGVVYAGFIGTSLTVTTAEMHSVRLRGYGQGFVIFIYEIFSFASSFATPYMLNRSYGNMGLNVGYFFGGLTIIVWVLIFFLVPETGRLTLEEIDEMFTSGKKAWNTSLKGNKQKRRNQDASHDAE